ncbi:hypothetical protein HDU97_000799 [Phlyctochytrium planicorne]|nr:hypothetical protein HDU97_000799 [Phlyctochytrium planicorne]
MTTDQLSQTLTILFASQTGNAEWIARHIGKEAEERGFEVAGCLVMDEYDKANLDVPPSSTTLLFVTSTTGDGDHPDNSAKFWRYLRRGKKDELENRIGKGRRFTVLGLGDTNYTNFNQPAKRLERRVLECGGKVFYPKALADDGTGLEQTVDPWIDGLWAALETVVVKGEPKVSVSAKGSSSWKKVETKKEEEKTVEGTSETVKVTETVNETEKVVVSSITDGVASLTIAETTSVTVTTTTTSTTIGTFPPLFPTILSLDSASSLPPVDKLTKVPAASEYPFETSVFRMERVEGVTVERVDPRLSIASSETKINTADAPGAASIVEAKKLNVPTANAGEEERGRRILEVTLDLAGVGMEEGRSIEAGDAIGVLGSHPDQEVLAILECVGIRDVHAGWRFAVQNPLVGGDVGSKVLSAYTVVKFVLDVRPPLRKPLLRQLAEWTSDEVEKRVLLYLCSDQGKEAFKAFKGLSPTFLEVLEVFPGVKIPGENDGQRLGRVCEVLGGGRIPTRFYSVAEGEGSRFKVMFTVVDFVEKGEGWERRRTGLCTRALEELAEPVMGGSAAAAAATAAEKVVVVPAFVKMLPGAPLVPFRLPKVKDVIMVAAGTGVAPFLGMVGKVEGEVWVLHGRRYDGDYAGLALGGGVKEGKVKWSEVVSRPAGGVESGASKYVQDVVRERADEVWKALEGGAAVLVCGSTAMAKDLHEALCEVVLKESLKHGGEVKDEKGAKAFWARLAKEGRYLKDVWG